MAREIYSSRHTAVELFRRDLRAQHRRSFLGVFLMLAPALATTGWAILFQRSNVLNIGDVRVPYPLYVLFGLTLWAAFLEALEAPIQAVLSEQNLLSKSQAAPEPVVAAKLGLVGVNTAIRLAAAAAVAFFYGTTFQWAALLAAPLGLLSLVLLGSGIGMLLAPFNLLYRDIGKSLPAITMFWFFLTPIFFAAPRDGLAWLVMTRFNPVTPILVATRDMALLGWHDPGISAVIAGMAAMVIFVGAAVFHRVALPIVLDRFNA